MGLLRKKAYLTSLLILRFEPAPAPKNYTKSLPLTMLVKTIRIALENLKSDYPFLPDRRWLETNQDEKFSALAQQIRMGDYPFSSLRYITEWQGRQVPGLQFSAPDGLAIYTLQLLLEEVWSPHWLPGTAWQVSQMDGLLEDIRLSHNPEQMALKTDVKKCFGSIRHTGLLDDGFLPTDSKLKGLLRQYLNALDRAATEYPGPSQKGVGLPLGTRLNHMLAHHYLVPVDSALAKRSGLTGAFRYLDDILLLGKNEQELHAAFDELVSVLASSQLEANLGKTKLFGKGEVIRFLRTDL
jgi:hypothetical protein